LGKSHLNRRPGFIELIEMCQRGSETRLRSIRLTPFRADHY
jgi:hypothetical protein